MQMTIAAGGLVHAVFPVVRDGADRPMKIRG